MGYMRAPEAFEIVNSHLLILPRTLVAAAACSQHSCHHRGFRAFSLLLLQHAVNMTVATKGSTHTVSKLADHAGLSEMHHMTNTSAAELQACVLGA